MAANNTISISELQQKANAGDAQAQFEMAEQAGHYDDKNNADLGLEWLNKAAKQGHVDAQFALGLFYSLSKNDLQKDRTSKIVGQWAIQDVGKNKAYDIAIRLSMIKRHNDSNGELAFAWFQKAAEQNHVEANLRLGECYRDGIGTEQSDEMALNCFRLAAEQGWVEAQYDLARCYFEGKGIQQNPVLGMQWCEKAAENGFAEAQYLLACCHFNGEYVQQSNDLALNWLKKAAENDHAEAQRRLADCYAQGVGVEKSDEQAYVWHTRAAQKNHAKSQYWLARYYLCGGLLEQLSEIDRRILETGSPAEYWRNIYFEKSYERAFDWAKNAVKNGYSEANFLLGFMFAYGIGVTQDFNQAFEIFKKANEYDQLGISDYFLADYYTYGNLSIINEKKADFHSKRAQPENVRQYYNIEGLLKNADDKIKNRLLRLNIDLHIDSNKFDLARNLAGKNTDIVKYVDKAEKLFLQNNDLRLQIENNKFLQMRMQKLVEQFTHTLGNVIFPDTIYQVAERLKLNPECRKDVLLLNEAYHSEVIIKLQSELLRQRYANNNPEKFRQFIRVCRRTPDSSDKTKSIADILDYTASRVTARFLNQHNASLGSIRDKILSCKNVSLETLKQKFEDDILLNRSLDAVEWINQNLRSFKVVEISPLWQKVRILTESHAEALLFGYFSEALFNAFKYADHAVDEFLTVVLDEKVIDGKVYLTCSWQNPLGSKASNSLGTGKGLDAIQEDLMQLNDTKSAANSLLITQENKKFQVTMFLIKELLINDTPILKIKRNVKME